MEEASEQMEFEEAIRYRDLRNSVLAVAQKQKITDSNGEDKDVIALAKDEKDAVVQVFFCQRRPPDRARALLHDACGRPDRGRNHGQFCKTVFMRERLICRKRSCCSAKYPICRFLKNG